jgi:nifR3 family TIM-barrel protein
VNTNISAIPTFYVNNIPVYGDLILSPMDGLSDLPFRSLARSLGSSMSYTEFVNAIDIMIGDPRVRKRTAFLPQERPVVFQIFDNDVDRIEKAVLKIRRLNPDIIDLNMGCPARSVSGRGAGVGLMRNPSLIAKIFDRLVKILDIPVTGKIRLGWRDQQNYLEVAHAVEDHGGKLIAVHGRTKEQGYSGVANWDPIAEIKQAVHIPVIGNGDVRTVADIERIKAHTHCDGVMIARGALDNPWIFSRKDRAQVTEAELMDTIRDHLQASLDFYGATDGLILFRKFVARYLADYFLSREQRAQLLTCVSVPLFLEMVLQIVDQGRRQTQNYTQINESVEYGIS